jgi:uncharacterized HAD superfamily protein/hypoxanthine phosphoribosyltransferase
LNFRSVSQLSDQVLSWSKKLPRDIDLVVGIPRSGMLAAHLLALYRNLAVADIDGFIEGRCLTAGSSRSNPLNTAGKDCRASFLKTPRKALIVDDSVRSGASIRHAKARIEGSEMSMHDISYGAVYVTPEGARELDYYCEILDVPRVFEWNILNHHILEMSCVDMDGVLCHDPLDEDNDDGERYLRFLENARPFFVPSYPIGYIVTSRLESCRGATEAWLKRHGIAYGQLIMLDYSDAAARRSLNVHSAHKALVYRKTGAKLFIESDIRQAVEIANFSKKDVLCIDSMQLISPGSLPLGRTSLSLSTPRRGNIARRIVRRILPVRAKELIRRVGKQCSQFPLIHRGTWPA